MIFLMENQLNTKIDVLLSVYNGEKYLKQLFESLENQSCRNFRLHIRNDGSTDSSDAILAEMLSQFGFESYLLPDNEHIGVISSYNRLLAESSADYIMFCDQDDVWLPGKIAMTAKRMSEAEIEFGNIPLLIHTDLRVVDENLKLIADSFWKYQHLNSLKMCSLNRVLIHNSVTACAMMINRPLARLVGKIPASAIMHDWYLGIAAAAFGKIIPVEEATILYRQHSMNTLGGRNYNIGSILQQAFSGRATVRRSIQKTISQSKLFLAHFESELMPQNLELITAWAEINNVSWWRKWQIIIKNRFYKNGLFRNIALFLLV